MKIYRKLSLILAGLFIMVSLSVFADTPPDPGSGPGSGDPPVGGGSPIAGGLVTMLILGSIYGAGKVYKINKGK